MVSVPHMSEKNKFAAVELEVAGESRKQIATQLGFSKRSDFHRGHNKSRPKSLATSHATVLGIALPKHAQKNASSC